MDGFHEPVKLAGFQQPFRLKVYLLLFTKLVSGISTTTKSSSFTEAYYSKQRQISLELFRSSIAIFLTKLPITDI